MHPNRLPLRLRLGLYGLAVGVLLFLCLAPGDELPPGAERIWDKAQHATAWLTLAGLGLVFWPRRPLAVAAFALGLGLVVEALQATMGLGRNGDWRDLIADVAGVGAALAVNWGLRRRRSI
jgi:VanZ family protein